MNLFKKLPITIINGLLIFLIVTVFLILTIVSYLSIFRIVDNTSWERHTHDVITNIDDLFTDLLNAETGQRGYIITGQNSFLDPYNLALQNIDKNFQTLQELTKDNPIQQKYLSDIRPLIDEKLILLKENITLSNSKGLNGASINVTFEKGKQTMDSIRNIMNSMETEEFSLLKVRVADTEQTTNTTKNELLFGGIIGLIFFFIVNYIINKFIIEGLVKKPIFEREKQLLESVGDGVIAIDRSFKITLFNKAATVLSGWSEAEAIGKPFRDIIKFIKTDTRKDNIVFIEEAMLYGETKQMESPTSIIQKNGQEISVGDSAAPVFDVSGQINGCIIVFRDMSKEIQLEKVKEDFTYRIVHDLRSPLTVIKSMLGDKDMMKKFQSKGLKEGYSLLNDATKQMLDMVSDLLVKSQPQKIETSAKKVAITDIIKDIVRTLKPVASEREVKCEYLPAVNLPMVSVKDVDHTKEIFTNLINNAIKYNKIGGSITITHEIIGQFLKTNIKDEGVGISDVNLKKISTPYARFNEKEGASGTGLGLYIVKNLVEESLGKLEITSKEGSGSTFSVYLPI
jgi:PAS domain S-box-containing protein